MRGFLALIDHRSTGLNPITSTLIRSSPWLEQFRVYHNAKESETAEKEKTNATGTPAMHTASNHVVVSENLVGSRVVVTPKADSDAEGKSARNRSHKKKQKQKERREEQQKKQKAEESKKKSDKSNTKSGQTRDQGKGKKRKRRTSSSGKSTSAARRSFRSGWGKANVNPISRH